MVVFNEAKQTKKLTELHLKEAEELAQALAEKYRLPYLDLSKLPINTDALRLIPEAEARTGHLAAFKITGRNLFLALQSPSNQTAKRWLAELTDKNYILQSYLVSEQSLGRCFERYQEISQSTRTRAGVIEISDDDIAAYFETLATLEQIRQVIATENKTAADTGGVSAILEVVLAGALRTLASDIHLEPEEERARLRYRLDGVLNDVTHLNHRIYQQILSRVKLISGLKLNINQSAQDGRFSIKSGTTSIEIRVSVLPGAYGESLVLRILNPETISVALTELGIEPILLAIMEREIKKPNGLLLLTGPTGSGKTTTLYAFLRQVNSPMTKIITIEDPIEYHLPGVNQTQVNPDKDYTFSSGLRSALRQDPDVIMVGEIRDEETAQIAINASLTGHLVFSTIHTNSAWGTIPRLIDLGVNPKVIESALNLSVAQRLTRRLCLKCRELRKLTPDESSLIDATLSAIREHRPNQVALVPNKLWGAVGCPTCHQTGYRGRVGIFEAMKIDPAVARVIVENPSERELKAVSKNQGLLDMRQDGILKVLDGITDLPELARVIDLTDP